MKPTGAGTVAETLSKEVLEILSAMEGAFLRGGPVHVRFPSGIRVDIDRPLPFLCVYRHPADSPDTRDEQVVTTQASFTVAAARASPEVLRTVLERVINLSDPPKQSPFLLLELWASAEERVQLARPRFTLTTLPGTADDPAVTSIAETFDGFRTGGRRIALRVVETTDIAPPGLSPLLTPEELKQFPCLLLGLEFPTVYRDAAGKHHYPLVLRDFRYQLSETLKRAFFAVFFGGQTSVPHYHALGSSSIAPKAAEVDVALVQIGASFDFLLYATPSNGEAAWKEFEANGFSRAPRFEYRPLPFDPRAMKARLYSLHLDEVEDPLLWRIFAEKQDELDRQITLLADRNTPRFRYGSVALYGEPGEALWRTARHILAACQGDEEEPDLAEVQLDAGAVAERAQLELAYYQHQDSKFDAHVEIRDDLAAGMMVSGNRLLISKNLSLSAHRVAPLLHHEIGTHLLTRFNGRTQGLKQLQIGLPGYETLQEGIAVLAEYLSGGLRRRRLRTLAARVEAVCRLIQGETFTTTFSALRDIGYGPQSAFRITTRVYRGGGLTKDAIYLHGLVQVLEYLSSGRPIERLLVGKMAHHHLPAIETLLYRGIVYSPKLLPRYLTTDEARQRLARAATLSLEALLEEVPE